MLLAADARGDQELGLLADELLRALVGQHLQPGIQAAAHRNGAQLGERVEGFPREGRQVLFQVPDQSRVEVIHMVFPDADHELGGHVPVRVVRRLDAEEEPLARHGPEAGGCLVGCDAGARGDRLGRFQPHADMARQLRLFGREQAL